MAAHIKKSLQFLLSAGLMGFFLYWAFKDTDAGELWEATRNLAPHWIVAMVATTFLTLVLRGWRWIVLMRPFAREVTLWDATLALGICYAANIFIPRSGEALRALSLNWRRGTQISPVLATVVVERIIDLIWLVLFLGLALLFLRERITAEYPMLEATSLVALAGCIVVLVILGLISVYRQRALSLVERIFGKISPRLTGVVVRLLDTFIHGLEALRDPRAYIEIFVSSVLLNLGYVMIIYESLLGFGFDQSHGLGLEAALVTMAISSVGMLFPTMGGAGTYHLFFRDALHRFYSIALAPALACATVVHALASLTYLIFGGGALLVQRRRIPRAEDKPVEAPPPVGAST